MKDLSWKELVLFALLVGAPILAHRFAPGAVAEVVGACAVIGAWLKQNSAPRESVAPDSADPAAPALVAPVVKRTNSKTDLKVISGGLGVLFLIATSVLACGAVFSAQDAADVGNKVNHLDKCEDVAKAVQADKCADGGPCQVGYDAYVACKKDGGS